MDAAFFDLLQYLEQKLAVHNSSAPMASYDKAIESYKKAITTAASVAASVMLVRSVVNELVPYEVRDVLFSGLSYLATRINNNMQRLRVSSMNESSEKMVVTMEEGEELVDMHDGIEFKWCLISRSISADPNNGNGSGQREARSYEVSFHRKHKEKALKSYLPFIIATAKAIKDQERILQIYMNEYSDSWSPIDLHHPSTFDTLAMDQKLLYGPPGTGKSSLIAAMANHLKFDIYDLELTEVHSNSELRRLLIGMTNRSILVIEDIDCTIELKQREAGEERTKSNSTEEDKGEDKVTLSGLLNFVDGLWSTSGEERIIIFTTNYKERLDQALLRPGRMDMHIHMGYCTPEAFRILASNYHSIDYHVTYPEIEELIKEVMVTPAEVAEALMRNDDTDVALLGLVELLAARINTDMQRLRASRVDDAQGIMITMDQGEEMLDVHDGVDYTWRLVSRDTAAAATAHAAPYSIGGGGANRRGRSRFEVKSFEVSFHKKHKEKALRSYLPFVVDTAKAMNDKHRNLKMHMIEYDAWTAVDLRHPSTFDTLAMDHSLLYGPPGTGKSSLIAAMANYLKFDIYDLELTEVKSNSDLRRLLVGMSNRSILVVEDIDCSIDLQQREEGEIKRAKSSYSGEENEDKVTLSGLLNFVDGLWSTSGEERIIVFTTNYRERLDPALLRPGRMDMHIHMGYCTPEAFRVLASNYHNVENHAMYPEIEQLIEEVLTTPAEVAEVLMRNDDVDVALQVLAEFLKAKRNEAGETKA